MTNIPVNIPGFAPNLLYGTSKIQDTDGKGDFGKIFENQKAASQEISEPEKDAAIQQDDVKAEVEKEPEAVSEVTKPEAEAEVKEASQAENQGQTELNDQQKEPGEELNLLMPVLMTAVADVKEMLVQEFGIVPEELEDIMTSLGIDNMELLDLDTLKEVLLQAHGAQDLTAVLTDENLYSQVQSLEMEFSQIMENLQETLQLDDEEIEFVTKQITEQTDGLGSENALGLLEESPKVQITVTDTRQESGEEGAENKDEGQAFMAGNTKPFEGQKILANVSEAATQNILYTSTETENIMNQIMDYMKIQLGPETDVLEMQLQPENLGTLQVRISAKEGIMTAQFTTPSEMVKAAIESQMAQLQQQFDEQNIKVEAIEVSVQTHQFESALEQGEEREQTQAEKKNRVRKIDLNGLEESDQIDEEDKIVAQMMEMNGNTVDYLV